MRQEAINKLDGEQAKRAAEDREEVKVEAKEVEGNGRGKDGKGKRGWE